MFLDKNGNQWYKIGLHIHTTNSDGKKTPEEAAEIYKNAGFDAIAITDHWKYGAETEIDGLKIISGCEYNLGTHDTIDGVMHIVGVGMKEVPNLTRETATRQETIDEIIRTGGKAVLAHPYWSLNSVDDVKALKGFSMLEIYNTVSDIGQSFRPYSGYIVDLLCNEGIYVPLIATDDAHYYNSDDECKSYIMVNCESCDTDSIVTAIEEKHFYATQGPELYVEIKNGRVFVDCSEVSRICFISNSSWEADRTFRGENLTHAEYEIKPHEKWIRVEVCDKDGKQAWSNSLSVFTTQILKEGNL